MSKIFIGLLVLASFAVPSEKTLFVLPPYTEPWFRSTPVVVENENKTLSLAMSADTLGWFRYTWDGDSLPDSVFIYKDSDSLFLEPVGFGGFPAETLRAIPVKILFNVEFSYRDSIFFIPEKSFRFGESDYHDGFYAEDARKEQGFFLSDKEFTLFVLIPDDRNWIGETPVIVDAKDSRDSWEMVSDDSAFPGWFRYTWKKADYRPEEFFLYGKSDSLRRSPIGKNGFALGRTDLVPFGLENVDSLFLVPDLNYSCYSKGEELYGDSGIVYLQDVRKNCPLKKLCLEKDFVPACHQIDFNRYPVYYSIYSSDSVLVKGEKALLPQYDCVYGGFNPGCANRIFVENGFCQLASGDYLVKIRDEASDSSFFLPYSVTTTALFPERFRQNIDIRIENSLLRIRSASPIDFAVFNSLGQIVSHGNVLNSAQVKLPASGNYLLKVGTEIRRVQIK